MLEGRSYRDDEVAGVRVRVLRYEEEQRGYDTHKAWKIW